MLSTDARGLEERNVGQKGKHIEEYGFGKTAQEYSFRDFEI